MSQKGNSCNEGYELNSHREFQVPTPRLIECAYVYLVLLGRNSLSKGFIFARYLFVSSELHNNDNVLIGHQLVKIVQCEEIFSIQDQLLYIDTGPARLW